MNGIVEKIVYKEKEIIRIDYAGCKEDDMILLITKARDLVITENKEVLLCSIVTRNNFVTPKVLRHLEESLKLVESLIKKNAVVGLSSPQLWILKGVNLWSKKKLHPCETTQEALDFLVG